jgi:hypothetical protein
VRPNKRKSGVSATELRVLMREGHLAFRRLLDERGVGSRDAALLELRLRTAIELAPGPAALPKVVRILRVYVQFLQGRVELTLGGRGGPKVPGAVAKAAFEWAALLTPRRIRVEDVGDAQEELARLVAAGSSRARITAYVVAQLFYITVNTVGYLVKKLSPFLGGKSSGS